MDSGIRRNDEVIAMESLIHTLAFSSEKIVT